MFPNFGKSFTGIHEIHIVIIIALCLSTESLCRPVTENVLYLPRLMSGSCNKKVCPAPKYHEEYKKLCGYVSEYGQHFVCLEDDQKNVIEFFMPDDLECEPGFYMKASIDREDPSRILLQKVSCPPNTYKQYESYCFKECVRQESMDYLPQEFTVIEFGSFKEPVKVECDAKKGYYSTKNETWFYFDRHLLLNYQLRNYCEKSEENPCRVGQHPLADGSCACVNGSWSEDLNICVQNDKLTDEIQQSTIKPIQTSSSYGDKNQSADLPEIILIVIGAATLIAVCGGILYYILVKRFRSPKSIVTNNNKIDNATFINGNVTYRSVRPSEETDSSVINEDDAEQSDEG